MLEQEALKKMVPPSKRRKKIWRGGILQIHVNRACDLACFNCTQLSQLSGKGVTMTPDEFEIACKSLLGYWGVVGIFGGNPALHPQFETLCEILRTYFPFEQRGIWCNHPRGRGAEMRRTFNPSVSNLNVHLVQEAYDEFARDWPECRSVLKGHDTDSRHSPVYVAMIDQPVLLGGQENTEANRLDLISKCDINQTWSAMVCSVPGAAGSTGRVRGFFCEIAGAMAMRYGVTKEWPDLGLPAVPGWWRSSMQEFAAQVRQYCHRCGVPLSLYGQLGVNGDHEEVSATHAENYKTKRKDRPVQIVQIDGIGGYKPIARVTEYIENAAR